MEKYDVFEMIAANGANVNCVCLDVITEYREEDLGYNCFTYICYGQNRLFTLLGNEVSKDITYGHVIHDYVVIPDLDEKLKSVDE